MKLGIVSDTHDNLNLVNAAVDLFSGDVDAVIHCGDVISPFSAAPFDADFDFYCAHGNNDGEWNLQGAIEEFGTYLGEMAELTFDGVDFAVYHGTSQPIVDALVDSGSYEYVLHGHTHRHGHEDRDGVTRINPGGLPIPPADDAFHVVTLDTESGDVEFHELG